MHFLFCGAVGGFLSVGFSAFGAHTLSGRLPARAMEVFQTAADYQFYHSLALVLVALLTTTYPQSSRLRWSGNLFVVGLLLFSGSLYLLSLTGIRWLGIITPFGGVSLMAGWLMLALFAIKDHSRNQP
ncbi:MAG: DUF423 domain-containing protein [Endozoicomonas sp.]